MSDDINKLLAYLEKNELHIWANAVKELQQNVGDTEALKERVTAAEAANELDRSRVPDALTTLNAAVRSRDWVLEGRGPYEWDDDDYRAEFSLWVEDVSNAMKPFAQIASDWHGCPKSPAEIRHARAILGRSTIISNMRSDLTYPILEKIEAVYARLRLSLSIEKSSAAVAQHLRSLAGEIENGKLRRVAPKG